ncbi:hypothetical protein [Litorimonas sp. WD9-15]|uniref:hypothetical protein n=1 Tax=Litorimonas sp. WD9-15 TaxID=3418716 RepID=UPI003D02E294
MLQPRQTSPDRDTSVSPDSNIAEASKKPILTDLDLLDELNLTEAMAADYLGKIRQTLNKGLNNAKDKNKPYFKFGELYTLIAAAASLNYTFSKRAVRDYIDETRKDISLGQQKRGKDLVDGLLTETEVLDLKGAVRLDIVLPGYAGFSEHQPKIVSLIDRHIKAFKLNPAGQLRCLTNQISDKATIKKDFGLSDAECKVSEPVMHYFRPLIFIYDESNPIPRAYMISDKPGFVEATHHRVRETAGCFDYLFTDHVAASQVDGVSVAPAQASAGLKARGG